MKELDILDKLNAICRWRGGVLDYRNLFLIGKKNNFWLGLYYTMLNRINKFNLLI